VQEAIANGVLVPGLMTDAMPRDFGEKPKMYNVWIGSPESGLGNSAPTRDDDSSDMPMPGGLSNAYPIAAVKSVGGKLDAAAVPHQLTGRMPSHVGLYGPHNTSLWHRLWPRAPRINETELLPTTQTLSALESQQQQSSTTDLSASGSAGSANGSTTKTVQVSLLIAMPSASQSRYENYIAQTTPNKDSISLPLPQLHPLAEETAVQTEPSPDTDDKMPSDLASTDDQGDKVGSADLPLSNHPHRLSESSMAKGKAPAPPSSHTHPHTHGAGVWNHLEEGEIPYMEFGVVEVLLDDEGKKLQGPQ